MIRPIKTGGIVKTKVVLSTMTEHMDEISNVYKDLRKKKKSPKEITQHMIDFILKKGKNGKGNGNGNGNGKKADFEYRF